MVALRLMQTLCLRLIVKKANFQGSALHFLFFSGTTPFSLFSDNDIFLLGMRRIFGFASAFGRICVF